MGGITGGASALFAPVSPLLPVRSLPQHHLYNPDLRPRPDTHFLFPIFPSRLASAGALPPSPPFPACRVIRRLPTVGMPCLPRFASRGRREVLASDLHSPIRKDLTTRISHRLDFRSEFPCASGLLSTPANSENTALSPVVSALAPNPGIQRRNAIYPERTFALFTSREGLFPGAGPDRIDYLHLSHELLLGGGDGHYRERACYLTCGAQPLLSIEIEAMGRAVPFSSHTHRTQDIPLPLHTLNSHAPSWNMTVTAFPIEAFRPWKPSRPKPTQQPRPPRPHHHKALVPVKSNPALPSALPAPAPPHSLDSQQNNQQHPLPARPPAEVCVHGKSRSDIQQSACPELSEEPVPTSGGSNELSVSELFESPAVSAMRAPTSPQGQTQCGSPSSDLNRLGDTVTTDIAIGSQCSIQGTAGCRSPSENPASSAQQCPGPHEPAVIPIDPAILSDEFPLESNQADQAIRDGDTLWSSLPLIVNVANAPDRCVRAIMLRAMNLLVEAHGSSIAIAASTRLNSASGHRLDRTNAKDGGTNDKGLKKQLLRRRETHAPASAFTFYRYRQTHA
ncbi:hypothetical protein EMGR_001749 [Emarellia grisea]